MSGYNTRRYFLQFTLFYFRFSNFLTSDEYFFPRLYFRGPLPPTHDAAADKVDSIVIIPSDDQRGTLPIKIISSRKFSWHTWIAGSLKTFLTVFGITKSRRNHSTRTKTADSYCDGDDDATRSFEYPPKTEYVNGKIDNFDFSSCPS